MLAQVRAPQAARVVAMGEAAFYQLAAPPKKIDKPLPTRYSAIASQRLCPHAALAESSGFKELYPLNPKPDLATESFLELPG